MPIVKPEEMTSTKEGIAIEIFGEAGLGKTTIALTTPNCILIDCDKGHKRAGIFKSTLVIQKGWKEVLELTPEIMKFDNIILDTAKAALEDFLMSYVIENDFKLARNKLQMYGAIADEFKKWIAPMRLSGKNLIFITHSKDEKEGDTILKYPDVTGGSYALLLRIADQVGYMHTENNKRVIRFTPTDRNVGKDTAQIGTISVPDIGTPSFDNFMGSVIQMVKDKMNERVAAITKKQSVITDFEATLAEVTTPEQLTVQLANIATMPTNIQTLAKQMLAKRAKDIGAAYSKANSKFEIIEAQPATP